MAPLKHVIIKDSVGNTATISMNENSWLHWSTHGCRRYRTHYFLISMNENSWLHWSPLHVICHLCWLEIQFPWMKIHGSIEAYNLIHFFIPPSFSISMNENSWLHWSGMVFFGIVGSMTADFHEWKFMAPLKLTEESIWTNMGSWFPWMKIHGSIEANSMVSCSSISSIMDFHEWKFMAPLKHIRQCENDPLCGIPISMNENSWLHWSFRWYPSYKMLLWRFPWMKIHGSIEARFNPVFFLFIFHISMNENSWLHWSRWTVIIQKQQLLISMNENSWLHWSSMQGYGVWAPVMYFHEWKFMAPLKLVYICQLHGFGWYFHEWKFMAPLKQTNQHITCELTSSFPWMKIHGSIEA